MEVDIKLSREIAGISPVVVQNEGVHLVSPGDSLTTDTGFMRGHGTYTNDGVMYSSVAGVVQRVNKLISVRPLKARYHGEIGDVVVGRITEVQQKRWKVETNARLDSILMLSSVNLPGGELRIRSAEDELKMREYLQEGDLISAEVQMIHGDGALSLHTRNLRYGKLAQGVLVRVSPSLIKRRKTHFHNLPCGASIILGNNGYIWICPTINEEALNGGFIQDMEPVPMLEREVIARLRNSIIALAEHKVLIYDTTVLFAYEASQKYQIKELMKHEVMSEVVEVTRQRLQEVMDS